MPIAENVISRRRLAKLSALSAAGAVAIPRSFGQTKTITAQEVVNQIKSHIGVPWNESSSRDTFKAGDPNTPVKGVASCFMSTLDVIKRANEAGLKFVITHEPTFWGDPESATMFKDDPILKIKLGYIEQNKMIVWRIHDHWHAHRPDVFRESMNKALGWTQYYDEQQRLFKLPATNLKAVADRIASATKSRSVRVVVLERARGRGHEHAGNGPGAGGTRIQSESPGFQHCGCSPHVRGARMGYGRICAGLSCFGREKGICPDLSRGRRRARDGGLRPVAPAADSGTSS
jgi:putative NIF3 family GTP cyclohydrolase 1 type 2